MKKWIIIFGLILPSELVAQPEVEAVFSYLQELQSEPIDEPRLRTDLEELLYAPVEVNLTDDYSDLFFLTTAQLESLRQYRRNFGDIFAVYELQYLPHWHQALAKVAAPFLRFDIRPHRKKTFRRQRYLLLTTTSRFPKAVGYQSGDYQGSAVDRNLRLKYGHGRWQMALNAQLQAGEAFQFAIKNRQYGADYYGGYLHYHHAGLKLFLGNFQLSQGLGLSLNQGFFGGKSSDPLLAFNRSAGVMKGANGSFSSRYFSGLGLQYRQGAWQYSCFASSRLQDYNIAEGTPTTQYTTGYHRRGSEQDHRHNVWQQHVGTSVGYRNESKAIFAGAYLYGGQLQLRAAPTARFQQSVTIGAYADHTFSKNRLAVELASNNGRGLGVNALWMNALSARWTTGLYYRYYHQAYEGDLGQGLSESGQQSGEQGLYWANKLYLSAKLWIDLYMDQFYFQSPQYRLSSNSAGYEHSMTIHYQPKRTHRWAVNFRLEEKERDHVFTADQRYKDLLTVRKWRGYVLYKYQPEGRWAGQSRLHISGAGKALGQVLAQDVTYRTDDGIWRFYGRFALFDVEDWEARQYIYEKNVRFQFSTPVFYGQGSRLAGMVQYHTESRWDFWLHGIYEQYHGRTSFGSGLDQAEGNQRFQLRLQVLYKW